MRLTSDNIYGRDILLRSSSLSIQHRTLSAEHYQTAVNALHVRMKKRMVELIDWMDEFTPGYALEFSVTDEPIIRKHPQQEQINEEVHRMYVCMKNDDDVFAFKMRWIGSVIFGKP